MNNCNRCGECRFFESEPRPDFETPCKEQGVKAANAAPIRCFVNAESSLKLARTDFSLAAFSDLFAGLTSGQLMVLARLLTNAGDLDSLGLSFAQKVYFQFGNEGYLEEYFHGYVLGVDGDNVVIAGSLDLTEGEASARSLIKLLPSSILSEGQFTKIKQKLVKANKLTLPACNPHRELPHVRWLKAGKPDLSTSDQTVKVLDAYQPPCIDDVEEMWSRVQVAVGCNEAKSVSETTPAAPLPIPSVKQSVVGRNKVTTVSFTTNDRAKKAYKTGGMPPLAKKPAPTRKKINGVALQSTTPAPVVTKEPKKKRATKTKVTKTVAGIPQTLVRKPAPTCKKITASLILLVKGGEHVTAS